MASSTGNNFPPPPTENDPLLTTEERSYVTAYEGQQRRRLILVLAIAGVFAAAIGSLVVWRLSLNSDESICGDEASTRVAKALTLLNAHKQRQSRHIAEGCEATVVLFRHCEKYGPLVTDEADGSEHCSYIGHERAAFVATLFGSRWPPPAHLFALSPDRGGYLNFRQWETLQPLSRKTGIVTELADPYYLAQDIIELLQSGILCGQVVVVSWRQDLIPGLAQDLGCGPKNGCPSVYPEDEFDQVWQLRYVFSVKTGLTHDEKEHETKIGAHASLHDEPYGNTTTKYDDDDDRENDDSKSTRQRRRLRAAVDVRGWDVYATVSQQNFDPLAYSYSVGDFPLAGTPKGARWKATTTGYSRNPGNDEI
jgi:hypothetical protein